ncbi:MAG: GTPase [Deltaproteobacteria bacterium DG_8]|nr:MAG: GTPase [Deltaproteobacteria bacterium DG_8]
MELIKEALNGSERAIAQLITMVENELPGWMGAMKQLYPHTGNAYLIGFTGPTGTGKSTLVDKVALTLCNQDWSVGIIAVDPSSPFTGGALLGDRIRMRDITNKEKVFIRSLGTRGSLGGISQATSDIIKILDASGKDFILVETVGIGQDEVEIAQIVDTSIVVSVPGLGDDIQTIKAGVMEIGDIFVVNKADREGADHVATMIKVMLDLNPSPNLWKQPVIKTIATENQGVDELIEQIMLHRRHLTENNRLAEKRKERIGREITKLLEQKISQYVHNRIKGIHRLEDIIEQINNREKDPYSCVDLLLEILEKE